MTPGFANLDISHMIPPVLPHGESFEGAVWTEDTRQQWASYVHEALNGAC